jgi:hypothetical protein
MLKRRIHIIAWAVLVGAALALSVPALALAEVVPDPPAVSAKRGPRAPISSPPLVIAEPDGNDPKSDVAIPASDTPAGQAPDAEPSPPVVLEPAPLFEPPAVPEAPPLTGPHEADRGNVPVRPPSGRLPTTGGGTAAALAGAMLSLGGLCLGGGRSRGRRAA